MIPSDQPLRSQMIKRMLSVLEDTTKLTKWESDFITSVSEQFELKGNLSQKQCEIIERLYDNL